jgi:hypothetical protein
MLISGGGGNRTSGDTPGLDDSRTVSRTGIDNNTSKEHEENALPDILVTMSQIPDVQQQWALISPNRWSRPHPALADALSEYKVAK